MLVGIAAVVLGIIALVGIDPVLVTLVALLVVGASVLFSGTAVSSRMASVMRRLARARLTDRGCPANRQP